MSYLLKKEGLIMSNKNIVKVTKYYERKVSLKPITSQYDNITSGTVVETYLSYDNQEDFDKKCEALSKKVVAQTEADIARELIDLAKKSKITEKKFFVGVGNDARIKEELIDEIEGFEKILEEENGIDIETLENKMKVDFEEVDIDDIDLSGDKK